MTLTPAELATLAAYARTGTWKEAAAVLGVSYEVARKTARRAYVRLGVQDAVSAFVALGWLVVPE